MSVKLSNAPESQAITSEDAAIFEAARSALSVFKKTFELWIAIGRAVVRAREIADRRGGRNTFAMVLAQQGLDEICGGRNKANATRLERIMPRHAEVTSWHERLPSDLKLKYASPQSIMRYCPIFAVPERKAGGAEEKQPKRKTPTERVFELEGELSKALNENHRLKHEGGSLFDLKSDSADDIATAIVANVTPNKAKQIAAGITQRLKVQKPAG